MKKSLWKCWQFSLGICHVLKILTHGSISVRIEPNCVCALITDRIVINQRVVNVNHDDECIIVFASEINRQFLLRCSTKNNSLITLK